MERNLTLSLLLVLSPLYTLAQSGDKIMTLGEVVVKASKVVNKIDGMAIYPTEAQKASAGNGYGILQKLALPNIKTDMVAHSVSATDNRGEVQIRINGIVAGRQELTALSPMSISRIDFINNPGLRYGDGIAYVIDIITRRTDRGYTVGTDINATLTSLNSSGMTYAKLNSGKSELSLSYDFNGYRLKGMRNTESANYTLNDGSIYSISRNDVATQRKRMGHNAKLTYNWADSTACVFQASLSGALYRTPANYYVKATARHPAATSSALEVVIYIWPISIWGAGTSSAHKAT